MTFPPLTGYHHTRSMCVSSGNGVLKQDVFTSKASLALKMELASDLCDDLYIRLSYICKLPEAAGPKTGTIALRVTQKWEILLNTEIFPDPDVAMTLLRSQPVFERLFQTASSSMSSQDLSQGIRNLLDFVATHMVRYQPSVIWQYSRSSDLLVPGSQQQLLSFGLRPTGSQPTDGGLIIRDTGSLSGMSLGVDLSPFKNSFVSPTVSLAEWNSKAVTINSPQP